MKIVKYREESGLTIKSISGTIKNEAKEQKDRFLSMLLGTLGISFIRKCVGRQRSYSSW